MNDELTHYGVKGMRWGVRKDQYRTYVDSGATTSTEGALKRTASKVQMARYVATGGKKKASVKFDDEWYDNLDTGKEFIKKGAVLNRVVRGVDQNALAGRLYVATLDSDSDMYKATIPYFQKKGSVGKKEYHSAYQVSMETKRKLTMPSEKERFDAFTETLQSKSGRDWLKNNGYRGEINELNSKEVGFKYYQRFNKYAGNQSVKFNDTYFNEIKSRGYNALIDDNDAGIWSKKPTILLSPKGDVRITKVKQLSADEINQAQRNVLKSRQYKTDGR